MEQVWKKWRWDGFGIAIAGLCLAHCLATSVILLMIASAGGYLLDPVVHEIGLVLAMFFAILALGQGYREHRFLLPLIIGGIGISIMAYALKMTHGTEEILVTMAGVSLLGIGHIVNHRAAN